jgi:hypothetical protein
MKAAIFSLLIFLLFGSCATVREKPEFSYSPPVELCLEYFESGCLSREEFLCLIRGSLAVKEMEALKIIASRRREGGMYALAKETRIKVDESMARKNDTK